VNCRFTGPVWWSNNDAVNNSGAGFYFKQGPVDGELLLIENNSARNGGNGFYAAGSEISLDGLEIGPNSAQVLNNVALGNSGFGFRLNGTQATTGNVANGNSAGGFLVVPNNEAFSGNSAIGNGGPGVIVNFSVDGDSPTPDQGESAPAFHAFSHNNFYGNDRHRPVLQLSPEADAEPPYNPGPGAHCGVLNVGELSGPGDFEGNPHPGAPVQLPANGNFWGSAQGPSATGPGDAIGGACDQNNGTTIVKTFATASF
jgi:hypothetical protein